MNGNTRIRSTGTTVRSEAIFFCKVAVSQWPTIEDAVINFTDSQRGNSQGTIGNIVAKYIDELETPAYWRFCAAVKKAAQSTKPLYKRGLGRDEYGVWRG